MRYLILLLFTAFSFPAIATDYAKKAHQAFNKKDYPEAGAFYEKAYQQNKINTYLENATAAYLTHAFNLFNEKKYSKAINFCQKVLALEPKNNNARELLSEIYFSRGSDSYYRGLSEKAVNDMEKSLQYSVLAEQKIRAEQEIAKITGKEYIKKLSNNTSIGKRVELIELKIYGEINTAFPMSQRVARLERDVFYKNYNTEGLVKRIKRLENTILLR